MKNFLTSKKKWKTFPFPSVFFHLRTFLFLPKKMWISPNFATWDGCHKSKWDSLGFYFMLYITFLYISFKMLYITSYNNFIIKKMFFIFQFYFSNKWIKYKFWKEKISFVQFIFFFFNFKHSFESNHFQNVSELIVFWIIQKLTFILVEKLFPQSFPKTPSKRDLETTFSFYIKNLTKSIVFFIFIFQLFSLLF